MKDELLRFKRSVGHALDGLGYAIAHEKNFRIELLIAFFVLVFIFVFKVKNWEAIVLIFMIMWVLVFELVNTVLERIVDILKPRVHPYARLIKDLMAGVVLICASISLVVGAIILFPYFHQMIVSLMLR